MPESDRFLRKLAALFHDPIDKPFTLMQGEGSHEERARDYANRLGVSLPPFSSVADHIAAAMERAFVPEGRSPSVRFLDDPEIRHPFSGDALSGIGARLPSDLGTVENAVRAALDNLDLPEDGEVPGRRVFMALWRNLIPALQEASPNAWAPLWDVAPADTRMPDHSIIQHLTVTSAFSSAERVGNAVGTNAAFVLFTIGPVQRFIQQARKTKDLYWGSALLSRLCWTALRHVVKTQGPDAVIFPNLRGQPLMDRWMEKTGIPVRNSHAEHDDLPTLPNRFFAVVEAGSNDELKSFLESLQEAVMDEWLQIGTSILEAGPFGDVAVPSAFDDHLRDALSTHWAAVPVQPGTDPVTPETVLASHAHHVSDEDLARARRIFDVAESDEARYAVNLGHLYALLYTLTEKRLGAQKAVRPFEQFGEGAGEQGRKCGLCGERNVLFYSGHPAQVQHNEEAVSLDGRVDRVHLRDGEGLCGACFTKRFVGHVDGTERALRFDSTADVATSTMQARHPSAVELCRSAMQGIVKGGHFDAQLLYEENLTPGYLAQYVYPGKDEDEDRSFLTSKAKALREVHQEHLSPEVREAQSSYYAVIALDGDGMGDWLAGMNAPHFEDIYHSSVWEQLPDEFRHTLRQLGRRPMTPALHATLSQALSDYALRAVRPIVEAHNGFLVYAGGDDVLAFTSVHEALDVLIHLRAAFSGHRTLDGDIDFTQDPSGFLWGEDRMITTLGPDATASAGVAIAHYKTPLQMVVGAANDMEDQAKRYPPQAPSPEKDAAAIAVLKRSGERNETTLPFRASGLDHPEGTLGVLRDIVADLQEQDVSPAFMRTLRRELAPLMDADGRYVPGDGHETELLRSEINRLIRRKAEASSSWAAATAKRLLNLYTTTPGDLDNFLSALDIALFLRKETSSARAPVDHAA